MNANRLVVFDTKTRTVAANLDGFPNVHGVLAVPELGRVYASTTGDHNVTVVDTANLRTVAKAGPVKYPDGLAYAPDAKRVFVSDEHGDADAVINTGTNSLIATVPLGGGAGNTVYDPSSKHILVAVHGKNELAVIDPATARIVNRYSVEGIEHPHGIALDVSARLAFVAGEGNNRVAVVDLTSMQVLATEPVGKDPDVLAFVQNSAPTATGKLNGAGEGVPAIMGRCYHAAIDIALDAVQTAQSKGLLLSPSFEDVRAIAATLCITETGGRR